MALRGSAMLIDSIMIKRENFTTITADTKVSDAATQLNENKFSLLIVCSDEGSVIGVLSEKDIVRGVSVDIKALPEMTVADLMTCNPMTCEIDSIPSDIMIAMNKGGFRHMPVVEGNTLGSELINL